MKFRKKPVVIDAILWDGTNQKEIATLNIGSGRDLVFEDDFLEDNPVVIIETLEGKMRANKGDWIIKGVKGELYPCKPDIFEATYEMALLNNLLNL